MTQTKPPEDEETSSALDAFREQMRLQAAYYAENDRLRAENTGLKRRVMNQRDTIAHLQDRVDELEAK